MRRALSTLLATVALIAGCQSKTNDTRAHVATLKTATVPSPSPSPAATAAPTAAPSVAPHASVAPSQAPAAVAGALAIAVSDTVPGTWRPGPTLVRPRGGLAVGVAGSRLLALEGDNQATYERLAIDGQAWELDTHFIEATVPVPTPTALPNGRLLAGAAADGDDLLLVGGTDGFGADPDITRYTERGFDRYETVDHPLGTIAPAVGVFNHRLLLVGGWWYGEDRSNPHEGVSNNTGVFDLASGTTIRGANQPVPVAGAASVMLGGKLYTLGGFTIADDGETTAVADVQVYDPAADAWRHDGDGQPDAPAPLPAPRDSAAAAVLDGKIYLVGGRGADGTVVADVLVYDPATRQWASAPALPTPRALLGAAAYQGELWAIGGVGVDMQPRATVEVFHP